jgi:DNA replication and repair protein RecF
MALVEKIRVQHVRTHTEYRAAISPTVTVITGSNGIGKTSLIEALYVALTGSSFKGVDKDIIQDSASWYRIDIGFADGQVRTVKYEPARQTGRKQFIIDGKTNYRLPMAQKYPVVLFEPDDLRLLGGSPSRRRQFIDRFISQIDLQYSVAVRRYERALKQRNALLKHTHLSEENLFAWNVSLSEYGAYIIKKRQEIIDMINQELGNVYATISGAADVVTIRYSHHPHANIQQKLLSDLHDHFAKDKIMGFTSVGPHRHDILFDFNGSAALNVASRGEIRSIILALKFLEVHITEKMTDKKPLILLDDVFSELDQTRQKNLVTEFTDHQIIITSVDVLPIKGGTVIKLS